MRSIPHHLSNLQTNSPTLSTTRHAPHGPVLDRLEISREPHLGKLFIFSRIFLSQNVEKSCTFNLTPEFSKKVLYRFPLESQVEVVVPPKKSVVDFRS